MLSKEHEIIFVIKMVDLFGHIPQSQRGLWSDKSAQLIVPCHNRLVFEEWDLPMTFDYADKW